MSFTCANIKYKKKKLQNLQDLGDNFCTSATKRPTGDNFAFAAVPRYYFPRRDADVVAQNGGVARANSRGEREARKQFFEIHSYSPATVKR